MEEMLISLLDYLGMAWWTEIKTDNPRCTYYFGPFLSSKAAEAAKQGYIEDLEQEGAQGIQTAIKRCKPAKLTISDDLEETNPSMRVLSGQLQ